MCINIPPAGAPVQRCLAAPRGSLTAAAVRRFCYVGRAQGSCGNSGHGDGGFGKRCGAGCGFGFRFDSCCSCSCCRHGPHGLDSAPTRPAPDLVPAADSLDTPGGSHHGSRRSHCKRLRSEGRHHNPSADSRSCRSPAEGTYAGTWAGSRAVVDTCSRQVACRNRRRSGLLGMALSHQEVARRCPALRPGCGRARRRMDSGRLGGPLCSTRHAGSRGPRHGGQRPRDRRGCWP
mmetsp:Transcript_87921/g.246984  ORF Transcript_87921/g.246984 Transcript_87921/m.246984 type:complete len:233 (+) Transcript_87921:12-710(+)